MPGWGGQRVCGSVCRAVFTALASTEGVVRAHRRGLPHRIAAELGDLQRARAQQRETEAAMVACLASLGLARLGEIPGLTGECQKDCAGVIEENLSAGHMGCMDQGEVKMTTVESPAGEVEDPRGDFAGPGSW